MQLTVYSWFKFLLFMVQIVTVSRLGSYQPPPPPPPPPPPDEPPPEKPLEPDELPLLACGVKAACVDVLIPWRESAKIAALNVLLVDCNHSGGCRYKCSNCFAHCFSRPKSIA